MPQFIAEHKNKLQGDKYIVTNGNGCAILDLEKLKTKEQVKKYLHPKKFRTENVCICY